MGLEGLKSQSGRTKKIHLPAQLVEGDQLSSILEEEKPPAECRNLKDLRRWGLTEGQRAFRGENAFREAASVEKTGKSSGSSVIISAVALGPPRNSRRGAHTFLPRSSSKKIM